MLTKHITYGRKRLLERSSLRNPCWFTQTGKCFETTTSQMQNYSGYLRLEFT
jgi:hypothetical protein